CRSSRKSCCTTTFVTLLAPKLVGFGPGFLGLTRRPAFEPSVTFVCLWHFVLFVRGCCVQCGKESSLPSKRYNTHNRHCALAPCLDESSQQSCSSSVFASPRVSQNLNQTELTSGSDFSTYAIALFN